MDKINPIVEIILVDQNYIITMHADRCVFESFQYFNNLFNFAGDKNRTNIKINVDNAKIAYEVILSLCEQKINIECRTRWCYSQM